MAFEKPLLIQTFTAASAMDSASMQFCLVKMDANGACHLCTSTTDLTLGVLQNLPSRGQLAEVLMLGISKVRVSGTDLAVGVQIATDATARAVLATAGTATTNFPVGRVIAIDAADNDTGLVSCAINTLNLSRGA
jgi:hypothetical protein